MRAIDQAGNADQSADSFEWTIDTAPPLVAIDSLSKSLLKAGESSEVSWHANENGAFSLRLGGSDCDSGTVLDSGAYGSQPASHISNVSAADLSEGANTLRLCLSDAAANRGADTETINKDTIAPDTQITVKPAALTNSASASFSFSGTDPAAPASPPSSAAATPPNRPTGRPAARRQSYSSLADGAHSFEVRAIDQAGNADQSADSFEWTIDTAPPLVAIDSLSKSLLKAGESSEVSWHANENGAFSLRLGGSDCDSGTVLDSGAYGSQPASHISNVSAADLSEGANTLRLCLSDAAANRGADTETINKDTIAPDTQITLKPAALTNSASASFSFSGTDTGGSGVASFQCRRDSAEPADWAACSSPTSYSSLADGAHSFEVRAIDQAGNADQSADSFEWTHRHHRPRHPDHAQTGGADQQRLGLLQLQRL